MIDVEAVMQEAREATQLDEFGSGTWRRGIEALIESAEQDAQLNAVGWATLRAEILGQLVNRLEIEDWVSRHPNVAEQRIEGPIVLATLPRTGQTAAGWILDRDPRNRSLYTYLAKRPVPPQRPPDEPEDPRIEAERRSVAQLPEALHQMHLNAADEPDECHWLTSNAHRGAHQIYSMRVHRFYEWSVNDADMREAYDYYRLQLQLLQSRTAGPRWVLKNSPHLLHLPELHEALPGAHFVQFHRDPRAVVASNCELTVVLRQMRSDHIDLLEIGDSILRLLGDYVSRALEFRDAPGSPPWIDVDFESFVGDPMGAVRTLYAELGIDLPPNAEEPMQAWVDANPRSDRRPDPDLTRFGIDEERLHATFDAYCERFGLKL